MASLVVARLGDIEFSLPEGSLTELKRATRWRVDIPDPISGLGKPDVRGRESDTITLVGLVFPGHTGKLDSVNRLRDIADDGKPLLLVDGEGTIYGDWTIVSLTEDYSALTAEGRPRKISWTLELAANPEEE